MLQDLIVGWVEKLQMVFSGIHIVHHRGRVAYLTTSSFSWAGLEFMRVHGVYNLGGVSATWPPVTRVGCGGGSDDGAADADMMK